MKIIICDEWHIFWKIKYNKVPNVSHDCSLTAVNFWTTIGCCCSCCWWFWWGVPCCCDEVGGGTVEACDVLGGGGGGCCCGGGGGGPVGTVDMIPIKDEL